MNVQQRIGRILWRAALIASLAWATTACERGDALPPQSGATTATDSGEGLLTDVIEQYAVLTEVDQDGNGLLTDVSAGAFLKDIEAHRSLLQQAREVPANHLSLAADIDRRLVIGLLESSIKTAEARRIWENDPSLYVPVRSITSALEAVAETPAGDAGQALEDILKQLPAQLENARANLKRPARRFTEQAIYEVERTLEALDEYLGRLATDDPVRASRQTLQAWLDYLRTDLLPRSDGSWALGRDAYDFTLQRRWFMDADTETILARGRAAFAETEVLAQEVAERMAPGKHWIEVYETLKDDHPEADAIKAAYQAQMDAAQTFVIDNRLVTLPAGERVITLDTPPAMRRSSPFGTFDGVGPFGDKLEGRLLLTPIEDWLEPEQRLQRLRSHHNAWIPVIAVHEAYPGHHAHALKTRENPRLLRKIVSEPIFSEGWGLYTEELMFELGFLEGDDVRLTQLRNRLWRAARVILDTQLHTGRISFDEAVDFLVEKVRFERYAAELEVGMYIRRPTYVLGYLIGMQDIAAIRSEYYELNGAPDPPSEFFDVLLSAGSIPPALVREEILSRSR